MSKQGKSKTSKTTGKGCNVTFKLARLSKGSIWRVYYYVMNPDTSKLVRKMVRIKEEANDIIREAKARSVIDEINKNLVSGWNPFVEEEKSYNSNLTLDKVYKDYLKTIDKKYSDGVLRKATVVSYRNNLNLFIAYINKRYKNLFASYLSEKILHEYLDYVYVKKGLSPATHNNQLKFLKLFTKYLISRGIIAKDITFNLKKIKIEDKIRQYIPSNIRRIIKSHLEPSNTSYLTLCFMCYYCLIRPKEITELRVKDIDIEKSIITVRGDISKNRKTELVTIPKSYLPLIKSHLNKYDNLDDYVFSIDDFRAGNTPTTLKRIQSSWRRMREKTGIGKEYQFYSLKDTGITNLLQQGIPSLKVKDQARHSDLSITETYIAKPKKADDLLSNLELDF